MTTPERAEAGRARARAVTRILILEGLVNLAVLCAKLWVAVTTGSLSVLGDALHSGSDLANNFFAAMISRVAEEPPDRGHPYGHRKFETLAVFVLGSLLTVLAFELVHSALFGERTPPAGGTLALVTMGGVLVVNVALTAWQHHWARKLGSELLRADALHTLGDVLTTVAVIAGWRLAAVGYPLADRAAAVFVGLVVMWLAYGLFRSAVPVLVDAAALDDERVRQVAGAVGGVVAVTNVRSRSIGDGALVQVVITVDPELTTRAAHAIADAVEVALEAQLDAQETIVHVEPDLPD